MNRPFAMLKRSIIRNMSTTSLPASQKAIVMYENSATLDVLRYADVATPRITSGDDVVVKNRFAGVNMIESYFRKGIYPTLLPYIFGREASGVVAAVGDSVTKYRVGDKVAYILGETFAQYTKFDQGKVNVMKLAKDTSENDLKVYGSVLIQALTALTFTREAYAIKKGDWALVWAAAGGVGTILTQLIAQRGAHVIAVASTLDKLDLAKRLGAESVINSLTDDVLEKVMEATSGKGVNVVYDSIGKDTFETSLASLARKGYFVSYGNASGVVPPVAINRLSPKNITLLRPQLYGYLTDQHEWDYYVGELKTIIANKSLEFGISQTFPLEQYPEAARLLESRQTTGKLVLAIPQ